MRLPVIRSLTTFIEAHEGHPVAVEETVRVLEYMSAEGHLNEEELDVIGELISNMCGSLEVSKMVKNGTSKSAALNNFMSRVLSSIDKNKQTL